MLSLDRCPEAPPTPARLWLAPKEVDITPPEEPLVALLAPVPSFRGEKIWLLKLSRFWPLAD